MASTTGEPGCCTSRVMASASMISAPRAASIELTVDFPEPIPPVSPTRIIVANVLVTGSTAALSVSSRSMGEEVDQRVRGNQPPQRDQMSLSWPLVERRRVHASPPGGVERRAAARTGSRACSHPQPDGSAAVAVPTRRSRGRSRPLEGGLQLGQLEADRRLGRRDRLRHRHVHPTGAVPRRHQGTGSASSPSRHCTSSSCWQRARGRRRSRCA